MDQRPTVLSAIQPTGDLHLGNYLGAVQNWVNLQDKYHCFYGVVDYHTMTMPYQAKKLRENTWNMVFQLLACGVQKEYLFIQSLVPEHAELCWILGCMVPFGDLTRMTQFKDKSDQLKGKDKDAFISGGLFYYPVLQAADILIYRADYVPVGKDQEQHLELSRGIANRFNYQFRTDYFKEPQPLFTEVPKVLSLADPTRKMSKSLGEKHVINLFGEPERIRKQVRSAVTDTGDTPAGTMSPGVENLFTLLKACGASDIHQSLIGEYNKGSLKYSELKDAVGDALVELTGGFKERLSALMEDKREVKRSIKESSSKIRERAQQTLNEVRELTGLMSL
jgi:tryptophanyl-tRNA synthetase